MDLVDIANLQIEMDKKHGFSVTFSSTAEKYTQISKDLVGLFGEIGEFSNIVKKINIKLDRPLEYDFDIPSAEENMREELIDTFIYLIRLSAILEISLESELLKKMKTNMHRYEHLQRKS